MENIKKAIELLKTNNVRWVHVLFTDIRGLIHDMVVPAREFIEGDAFTAGLGFDGSSVKGYKTIEESDMVLVPDPNTLAIIPWSIDEGQKSAVVIGDVHEAYGGGASEVCPRSYVAKRAAETAQGMGYTEYFAPELEYFLFSSIDLPKLVWNLQAGSEVTPGSTTLKYREAYCRPPPEDTTVKYRNEVSSILEDYFGFEIEKHHHEVAASQIEIDFAFGPLVETADKVMYFKFVAKNIAKKYGLIATFMPKPIYFDNASGMHTHVSLWRGEKNEMYDENDEYAELSQTGRYFIGGLLEHARALTAICCPTVNSYKRLVPGFEAPIYITWSRRNRSALVRIPVYYRGPKYAHQKRVEYRGVDPSCNPYLAFACLLMAGLDGIKKKIDPGDPVDEDVYKMSPQRRRALGIRELPTTLKEALEEMKSDEIIRQTLGSHIYDAFIEYKTNEWNQYCFYVTPWEFIQYLDY